MPRKTRMYLPGIPVHVVQRGNNRHASFFCKADYEHYLDCLSAGLRRYGVALHAYVLMTNHVHLLMTPTDQAGVSRLMQHVGRSYVLHVNRQYRRSGTLWEGRHKASLVHADEYLLACMRYIEMNPVAAGMVQSPEQYDWSSYRAHALGKFNSLLSDHAVFTGLGADPSARRQAYRNLFAERLPLAALRNIRACLAFNHPLGNDRFRNAIEAALGRRVGRCKIGRPRQGDFAPK